MNGFTLTRSIAASPQRVWSAFTSADEYATWIWPAEWNATCSIDLRVGGQFRVASDKVGLSIEGTYLEIDPITRLVLGWRQTNRQGDSRLTITIQPTGDETLLSLTHDNFPDDESRAAHEAGWTDCLDRLPAYLAN